MNGSFGKAPKYVSPFVADALYRAKLRANNAPKATSRQRHTSVRESEDFSGGWDSSVSRNALFDPKIQKQELFKIAPRRPAGKDPEPVEDLPRESQDDDNATRMTRRRSDLSPPRRPRSALQPYPSSSRDIIIRQSVDRSSKDTKEALTTVHGQDLRDPYVKVCNACHGGGGVHNHAHSNGHSQGHSSNRSPARYRSPPQRPHLRQVRAERPSTHPSHPHITSRGNLTRLSQDSLVSRARAEQEAGDDDVVRVVTRATSPIDEITLQYLNEGRDPSWVALSGLDPSQPTENPVLFQHEHHDIAMMPGRRQVPTPAHRTPLQSAYSHQPPPASMASRHDLEAIHMVPGSAFATRSASNKVPYRASLNNSPIRSMAGTPAHNDLNVPKFQSSLDASQFEESFHEANTMQNVYKVRCLIFKLAVR